MRSLPLVLALLAATLLPAQQPAPHALFPHSTDIGPTLKGSTAYDPAAGDYRLSGGGADMWATSDAFRFAWTRLSGDATLSADVTFPSAGVLPLEKGVLLVRQTLDPASPYADVAIHGDGHMTLSTEGLLPGKLKTSPPRPASLPASASSAMATPSPPLPALTIARSPASPLSPFPLVPAPMSAWASAPTMQKASRPSPSRTLS